MDDKGKPSMAHQIRVVSYCLLNIFSAAAIVFANKAVFYTFNFKFVITLTMIHTVFTWVSMNIFATFGMFQRKSFPVAKLIPVAAAYVGYIVLCNVSLNLNTVGFYQIMKISIAPTVVILEFFMFSKIPTGKTLIAVAIVCVGVAMATVTEKITIQNISGLLAGIAATLVTGLYQIWAGSKQKELEANSSQLLAAYSPVAVVMMAIMVPIFEPTGVTDPTPDTLLGFNYTTGAVVAIVLSAVLGVIVSLSMFLVIGSTSAITYNIIGHTKTVLILAGGYFLFGDPMSFFRVLGIVVALVGILWYTQMTIAGTNRPQPSRPIKQVDEPLMPK